MSITAPSDVALGYKGDVSDPTYVSGLIERAERKLSARLGDLTAWANTEARAQAVKDVVAEMVQRVLTSGGSEMKQESDGEYSYTVDPRVSSGSLWVTDENWATLMGPSTDAGVGTIRVRLPEFRRPC